MSHGTKRYQLIMKMTSKSVLNTNSSLLAIARSSSAILPRFGPVSKSRVSDEQPPPSTPSLRPINYNVRLVNAQVHNTVCDQYCTHSASRSVMTLRWTFSLIFSSLCLLKLIIYVALFSTKGESYNYRTIFFCGSLQQGLAFKHTRFQMLFTQIFPSIQNYSSLAKCVL